MTPELMKLIFAVLCVSRTMGLMRCYNYTAIFLRLYLQFFSTKYLLFIFAHYFTDYTAHCDVRFFASYKYSYLLAYLLIYMH